MSSLTPSSLSRLNPASIDSTALSENEARLQSLPLRTDEWISVDGLRFFVKRSVDLVGASLGLLFLSPIMLLVALLIRFDSPGPVLFRQLRRGYRGRIFPVLKFRTMSVDAEQQLHALEQSNESAGGVLFKLRNDPRVTRVGSILRRYSLDELGGTTTSPAPRQRPSPELESRGVFTPAPGNARTKRSLADQRTK
jgi:lipopolysaccharide/colanic/teichoic acid biosynthesis glycosyltransferase